MNEQRLSEIRKRLEGATPTENEPSFKDEVWFIKHLEEIIAAYRQDIPDLLAYVARLEAALRSIASSAERHTEPAEAANECEAIAQAALEGGA